MGWGQGVRHLETKSKFELVVAEHNNVPWEVSEMAFTSWCEIQKGLKNLSGFV